MNKHYIHQRKILRKIATCVNIDRQLNFYSRGLCFLQRWNFVFYTKQKSNEFFIGHEQLVFLLQTLPIFMDGDCRARFLYIFLLLLGQFI